MNKLPHVAAFLYVLLFLVVTSSAQAVTNARTPHKAAEQAKKTPDKHFMGTLMSVDAEKGAIVIRVKSVEYRIETDTATKIQGSSGKIILANLKTGLPISITYQKITDKRRVATTIVQQSVSSPAAAPAQKHVKAVVTKPVISVKQGTKSDSLVKTAPTQATKAAPSQNTPAKTDTTKKVAPASGSAAPAEPVKAAPVATGAKADSSAKAAKGTVDTVKQGSLKK